MFGFRHHFMRLTARNEPRQSVVVNRAVKNSCIVSVMVGRAGSPLVPPHDGNATVNLFAHGRRRAAECPPYLSRPAGQVKIFLSLIWPGGGTQVASYFSAMEQIVILDFGSQFTQVIARRIRECHVYSTILRYDTPGFHPGRPDAQGADSFRRAFQRYDARSADARSGAFSNWASRFWGFATGCNCSPIFWAGRSNRAKNANTAKAR